MPKVESLQLAPIKSARAQEGIDELVIDSYGLFGDRDYMFVETADHENRVYKKGTVAQPGQFLSQREDPVLTSIAPTAIATGILLTASGRDSLFVERTEEAAERRRPVSVWGWAGEGVDQGNEAADWVSDIVRRQVRLVAVSDDKPRYVEGDPSLGRVGFADAYPITVASDRSFRLLNQELEAQGRQLIPTNRMRATAILSGLEILENPLAFPEDYIETITIRSNGEAAVLRRRKACGRCPIPDTDQLNGARNGRPVLAALNGLKRYGRHRNANQYGVKPEVFFSQNFVIDLPRGMAPDAVIRLEQGAQVDVTYSDMTNWISR